MKNKRIKRRRNLQSGLMMLTKRLMKNNKKWKRLYSRVLLNINASKSFKSRNLKSPNILIINLKRSKLNFSTTSLMLKIQLDLVPLKIMRECHRYR